MSMGERGVDAPHAGIPDELQLYDEQDIRLGALVELELVATRRLRLGGEDVVHHTYRGRLVPTPAWKGSDARRLVLEADEMANDGAFAVHEELQEELKSKLFLAARTRHTFVTLEHDDADMMRLTTDVPLRREDPSASSDEVDPRNRRQQQWTARMRVEEVNTGTCTRRMELLTPETPPRAVAERFAGSGTVVGLSIPYQLDRSALEAIARAHVGHPHGTCVLDLVVAHPACDAALLELVLELGAGSSQIANTVATSGKATVEQLRVLKGSDVPSVREHAELALLEHELRDASPETFSAVLHWYRDHETLGYAVRHRLATHPQTPQIVLRELASLRDAIGELASGRLSADVPMQRSTSTWAPAQHLALEDVLLDGSLGGLRVGDASDRIEAALGPPQAPAQRIGRRSKLKSWLYGNVTVLEAGGRVEGIELDFEGERPTMVDAGAMAAWSIESWRTYAERKGWSLREGTSVVTLVAPHAIVSLEPDGTLHTVSLRAVPGNNDDNPCP